MKIASAAWILLAASMAGPALANDTMAQLGTGGLVFLTNESIEMASEDLSISVDQVKVVYRFRNTSDQDQDIFIAFPMPDITGNGDFMVSVPDVAPDNLFGFETTFDGQPVEAELHRYAFSNNIDYTELLTGLDIPLEPFGSTTTEALNALPQADKDNLLHLGLVIPMEYDAGQGWQTDYVPVWTLRSAYGWDATFPAGEEVEVVHTYQPSVGGTVATTFMVDPDEYQNYAAEYADKYCIDDDFRNAVERTMTPGDPYSAPFTERWLTYIWSTGSNWSGPIGRFTLTVDKGDTKNLVSFCGDNVTKIGPTTFQMVAEDFFPPYDRELEILILDRMDPVQN
jgi:hypothetical protein